MNGWNTKQSWELAMAIDNTEALYFETRRICEEYRKENICMSEAIAEIYHFLVTMTDLPLYGYADIQEYIESHEE